MDIGAAGALILYFSVFIALVLIALLVFSYAAYSFLVVLSNTAVGNDEVIWPGEPLQDWFFKGWYLGWLLAVWAVPASFLARLVGAPGPSFAVCVAACLWLFFPIGLLSSLSAESRLLVFRPIIVGQLLKHLGVTLRFYASSGLVVFVCGTLAYSAAFGLRFLNPSTHKSLAETRARLGPVLDQPVILVPLAAMTGAAGCLIYARLLGRTAFLISQSRSASRKERGRERGQETDPVASFDPWSFPDEKPRAAAKARPRTKVEQTRKPSTKKKPRVKKPEDPNGPAEGTYDVLAEEASPPPTEPPARHSALDPEDVQPYGISAASEVPPSNLVTPDVPEVSKREEELAAPRVLPPLPAMPLVGGVYSFPFYPQTMGPWGTVALGLFGVFALVRCLFYLFPA